MTWVDLEATPELARIGRRVQSWATGGHLPNPYHDGARWRCLDCGLLLTRYRSALGAVRLRHHPRGAR